MDQKISEYGHCCCSIPNALQCHILKKDLFQLANTHILDTMTSRLLISLLLCLKLHTASLSRIQILHELVKGL